MCPARHARLAFAGSPRLHRSPEAQLGIRRAGRRRHPSPRRPGVALAFRSPPHPSSRASRRRDPRPWPSRRARPAAVRPAAVRRPPSRRRQPGVPYFIELALRGLAQGWVHGAPQGLDNRVGVHDSADSVKPGTPVQLGQE